MTLHFTNALLIDPEGGEHLSSLTIEGETITAIGGDAPAGATLIDAGGHCLAPGIVDWGVKIGEPGERHRESFRSAGLAAAAGGVTTIIARPDTKPAIDTPETLEFVTRRAAESVVRIRHMAALTKGREGQEMTEIGFLLDAGAIAFTDVFHVSTQTKALARAMTYARSLGALIVGHPQEPGLSAGAAATHGKFASLYGLPSVSPMAEKIGLDRDLGLIEMTGARYHFDQITVAASLPALERAKKTLDVTAGVSIHHLTLNEYDVGDYRTFFKMTPPLRSEDDRMAMIEAVAEGVIDVIASFHTPADEESKRLPYEEAASGAVGLQTLLPAALRLVHGGHMSLSQLWRALSLNPAQRLGLPQGRLKVGAPADLVLFDPHAPFVLDRFKLASKSKNTPFDGARMEGKVLGTWVAGQKVH
ncbi:dihydroorotase [Stagnihabitans tardus]|uniref:Amidohydrolase family protein n=1 Tax=Stagnihabitans tardus TaxID=2699202 RepID=A0AAE4YDF2_9RHOB|nr:dihydroorotase [Stagnihabitans tardus]NBZ89627.1 amidohydrolase family protein [Stagnihabitans tardus]